MNIKAMNMFLSEENIAKHLDYYRTLKLKYSILEKSFPVIAGKKPKEISSLNLKKSEVSEVADLLWEIMAHECYFDSFATPSKRCDQIKKYYSSQESFIHELYSNIKDATGGFLFVYLDKFQRPRAILGEKNDGAFVRYQPILALDLCEHAYFSDYGFKKDKYFRSALGYFDLTKLYSLDNGV